MPEYGKPAYWEERYQKDSSSNFDWYCTLVNCADILRPYLSSGSKILHVGCGNSRMATQLYDDGYKNVTNIDISETVVHQMQQKYADQPELTFQVMDTRRMTFDDESFDVVVDKATLDALLCGRESFDNAYLMNKEVQRVLKPGGVFICISYGTPDSRLDHFSRHGLNWTTETKTIPKALATDDPSNPSSYFYVYVMRKRQSNVDDAEPEPKDES
ncbi:hypothetical protein PCE1_001355 [Barthelona sp. PCE]